MSFWQPWPPRYMASAFILPDGSRFSQESEFGIDTLTHPSTGVYEVTYNFGLSLAQQVRGSTYVVAIGNNALPDIRVSAIFAVSGTPYAVRYEFRDSAGNPVDTSHTINQLVL